eukprot:scaffold1439_cov404-Prasinococcus_capsulatus_cf.AAC.64
MERINDSCMTSFGTARVYGLALSLVCCCPCLTVCGWLESECTIVTFLSVAGFCSGFTQSGYANNHIDLSMRYTGVLMGISNSCSSIPGIVGPQEDFRFTVQCQSGGWTRFAPNGVLSSSLQPLYWCLVASSSFSSGAGKDNHGTSPAARQEGSKKMESRSVYQAKQQPRRTALLLRWPPWTIGGQRDRGLSCANRSPHDRSRSATPWHYELGSLVGEPRVVELRWNETCPIGTN